MDREIYWAFLAQFAVAVQGPAIADSASVRRFRTVGVLAILLTLLGPSSSTLHDIPPVAPLADPFVRGMNKITRLEDGRIILTKYVRKAVDPLAQPVWKTIPPSSFLLLGTAMLVAARRVRRRALARIPA